jgi:hypothetical protein
MRKAFLILFYFIFLKPPSDKRCLEMKETPKRRLTVTSSLKEIFRWELVVVRGEVLRPPALPSFLHVTAEPEFVNV